MVTKAEDHAQRLTQAGWTKMDPGTLGHGNVGVWQTGRSFYVHLVKWWKPADWLMGGQGIWACGNMSAAGATLVTEIPTWMQPCHVCQKKRPEGYPAPLDSKDPCRP